MKGDPPKFLQVILLCLALAFFVYMAKPVPTNVLVTDRVTGTSCTYKDATVLLDYGTFVEPVEFTVVHRGFKSDTIAKFPMAWYSYVEYEVKR